MITMNRESEKLGAAILVLREYDRLLNMLTDHTGRVYSDHQAFLDDLLKTMDQRRRLKITNLHEGGEY